MAVNCPNAGEINLMTVPAIRYHPIVAAGPYHPTRTESFLEKRMMSSKGFEKLL